MKKFISMVMAAAMVVSLVPATAFASTAAFKVQGAHEWTADEAELKTSIAGPQVQIIMTDVDTEIGVQDSYEITFDFDNAEFLKEGYTGTPDWAQCVVVRSAENGNGEPVEAIVEVDAVEFEDTSFTITVTEGKVDGKVCEFTKGDMIVVPIDSSWGLTSDSEGTVATVTVSGDFGESEAMPVASVLAEALDVTVAGKVVEVAEEEIVKLKDITVESVVGTFVGDEEIKVKVSKGFEFTNVTAKKEAMELVGAGYVADSWDDDTFKVTPDAGVKEFKIKGLKVEAVEAKAGDIATITVSCKDFDSDSDEAAEVIADAVIMSVDEDEDVPEIYAGTAVGDAGLTAEGEHKALTVTIEESVAGAWDTVDSWTLGLPEGVYVTALEVTGNDTCKNWKQGTNTATFAKAYQDGDYEAFEFGRRAFEAYNENKAIELTIDMVLVAEPTFTGDVVLTLEGEGIGEEAQEVVIAKFVAPYTVEAAQNDLVIDYKETVVPTAVVITEAEEGLWANGTDKATFELFVEDGKIEVEDAEITVDEESGMEIDADDKYFEVDEESDEAAAVVTMDDVTLYMKRDIPAGAYDLELSTKMYDEFLKEGVWAAKDEITNIASVLDVKEGSSYTVKEGFINVITAGRDQDDASFTKKVVVPVGAMEIVAGEETVALDVPAYINAAGYTMLPVRAVAVALGINTNNVIWDQATKQVTILYGNRIIAMTVGSKVISVNGSSIPASAAVEIVNGRTFLGLRDLATALGVTDITWDAATQTATLNGNK